MKSLFSRTLMTGLFATALTMSAQADEIRLTTDKAEGEYISIALNAGVTASLTWDDKEAEEVVFGGDIQDIMVQGKNLIIRTDNPVTSLYCSNNALTSLTVSSLQSLETLICNDNNLTTLSLSSNSLLKELSCQRNNLSLMLLGSNKSLESVNVAQNPISSFVFSSSARIKDLNIAQTDISTLNVASLSSLYRIWGQEGQLKSISLPANLKDLFVYDNAISELDLSKASALENLWVSDNELTTLKASYSEDLLRLIAENNQLTSVGTSVLQKGTLEDFYVGGNQLLFNSFPTLDSDLAVGLTPQSDYSMNVTLGADDVLELDDLLKSNAWRSSLNAEIVWKKKSDQTPLTESEYEEVKTLCYQFKNFTGDIYGEVTTDKYPDVMLKISDIHVGEGTGITELEAAGCSVKGGSQCIVLEASQSLPIQIVRADGTLVVQEKVGAGVHRWNLPAGIYIVNNQKIVVRK